MKRLWLGLGLGGALLGISLTAWLCMGIFSRPVAELLEEAAQSALREDWETAAALAEEAGAAWEERRIFFAAVNDHEPMEDIESLFYQLLAFGQARERPEFAAVCVEIASRLRAMGDTHRLNWENFW